VFDKIDRAEYAVKKIIIKAKHLAKLLNEGRSLQGVLKEMQTLAKLHHPHVVRYYHSWVEFRPAVVENVDNHSSFDSQSALDESLEAATVSKKSWQQSDPRQAQSVVGSMAGLSLGQIDNELLAGLKNEAGYDSAAARQFVVFDETKPRSASQTRSAVITETSHSMALEKQENLKATGSKADVDVDAVLYIKMAAYPLTLYDYLHHKNTKGGKSKGPEIKHCFHVLPTTRILLSIVHGMQYIHRQGIIHRDLKPNNIFISILEPLEPATSEFINITDCSDCGHSNEVKPTYFCVHIGDFGLIHEVKNAALLQETDSRDVGSAPKESSSGSAWRKPGDSFVVGTPYYAPPKVHGVKETFCPKRDCYALGIIALELIYPFVTSSERHQILEKLRVEGVLPAELATHKMVDGIMGMLKTDIAERWDLNRVNEWLLELEQGCLKD
jgi:translation initiation factor 2-alpha kinase 3